MNAIVTIGGGMPSAYIGGMLGDYYTAKGKPQAKGYISGIGALLASLFIVPCYLFPVNFYLSIVSLYFAYLFAEVWMGLTYSMINQLLPAHCQGIGK